MELLSLGGNKINNFSDLESLKVLKNLKIIDLNECEITSKEDYRKRIFEMMPDLNIVDGQYANGQEVEMTEESNDVDENGHSHLKGDESDDEDDEYADEDDDEQENAVVHENAAVHENDKGKVGI